MRTLAEAARQRIRHHTTTCALLFLLLSWLIAPPVTCCAANSNEKEPEDRHAAFDLSPPQSAVATSEPPLMWSELDELDVSVPARRRQPSEESIRAVSGPPYRFKPISEVLAPDSATANGQPLGDAPHPRDSDYATAVFAESGVIDARGSGSWKVLAYSHGGQAAIVCHRPLRFEEYYLERYGRSARFIQPAVSAARFYGSAVLCPLQVIVHPRRRRVYPDPSAPPPGIDATAEFFQPPPLCSRASGNWDVHESASPPFTESYEVIPAPPAEDDLPPPTAGWQRSWPSSDTGGVPAVAGQQ